MLNCVYIFTDSLCRTYTTFHDHFAFTDDQHLILKKDLWGKKQHGQQVAAAHEIVLLPGDNFTGFNPLFDIRKTTEIRAATVQQLADEFGKRFMVLPNANYGGWEDAFYCNTILIIPQKDSAIKRSLKNY
jgi:5'-nucleotidase (lipoprotein e(P4) family)